MRSAAVALQPHAPHATIPTSTLHIAQETLSDDELLLTTSTGELSNIHIVEETLPEPITFVDEASAISFTRNLLDELNTELGLLKGSYIDTYSLNLSKDGKTLTLKGRASTNHFKGEALRYLYNRLSYGQLRSNPLAGNIRTLELKFTVGFYPSPDLTMNI